MLTRVRVVQREQVETWPGLVQLSGSFIYDVGGGEGEGLIGQEVLNCHFAPQVDFMEIGVRWVFQIGRDFTIKPSPLKAQGGVSTGIGIEIPGRKPVRLLQVCNYLTCQQ
jgi:hypothetical protein